MIHGAGAIRLEGAIQYSLINLFVGGERLALHKPRNYREETQRIYIPEIAILPLKRKF